MAAGDDYDENDPAQFDPGRRPRRVSYEEASRSTPVGPLFSRKTLVVALMFVVIALVGLGIGLSYECAVYHADELWNPGYNHDFVLEFVCPKK